MQLSNYKLVGRLHIGALQLQVTLYPLHWCLHASNRTTDRVGWGSLQVGPVEVMYILHSHGW